MKTEKTLLMSFAVCIFLIGFNSVAYSQWQFQVQVCPKNYTCDAPICADVLIFDHNTGQQVCYGSQNRCGTNLCTVTIPKGTPCIDVLVLCCNAFSGHASNVCWSGSGTLVVDVCCNEMSGSDKDKFKNKK